MNLDVFVKSKRKSSKLTQPDLAQKAGVGLRFLRELEQGKESLRIDKVNEVLRLFGYEVGPVEMDRSILLQDGPLQTRRKKAKKEILK